MLGTALWLCTMYPMRTAFTQLVRSHKQTPCTPSQDPWILYSNQDQGLLLVLLLLLVSQDAPVIVDLVLVLR